MRITGKQLRKIIKEEILREGLTGMGARAATSSVAVRMSQPAAYGETLRDTATLLEMLKTLEADGTLSADPAAAAAALQSLVGRDVILATTPDLVNYTDYDDFMYNQTEIGAESAHVSFRTNIDGDVHPYKLVRVLTGAHGTSMTTQPSDLERMMGARGVTTSRPGAVNVKLVLEKTDSGYDIGDSAAPNKLVITPAEAIIMMDRIPDIKESLELAAEEAYDKDSRLYTETMKKSGTELMGLDLYFMPSDPVLSDILYADRSDHLAGFYQSY